MELTTLRVAAALETAGIANVPLKGPLLARSLHGDPGMRFSRDIDVLVARSDMRRAAAALEPLGWRLEDGAGEPVLHLALTHGSGLPEVELHWRVHWYEAEFAARALERAQPGPDGVRRLQSTDELTALLLYHARDGFAGLRHAIDAAAWWDAHADAPGVVVLAPIALEHPELTRALSASASVLDELVGVPADRLVPSAAGLAWGARRAVALANPLMRGKPQQITAEITLVDALLAPVGQRRHSCDGACSSAHASWWPACCGGPSSWLAPSTYYDFLDGCCLPWCGRVPGCSRRSGATATAERATGSARGVRGHRPHSEARSRDRSTGRALHPIQQRDRNPDSRRHHSPSHRRRSADASFQCGNRRRGELQALEGRGLRHADALRAQPPGADAQWRRAHVAGERPARQAPRAPGPRCGPGDGRTLRRQARQRTPPRRAPHGAHRRDASSPRTRSRYAPVAGSSACGSGLPEAGTPPRPRARALRPPPQPSLIGPVWRRSSALPRRRWSLRPRPSSLPLPASGTRRWPRPLRSILPAACSSRRCATPSRRTPPPGGARGSRHARPRPSTPSPPISPPFG